MKLDYSKKISVVIPTRNRAEFLGPCIQTCTSSDDQNLEVIVSNNNSSDNTEEVIRSFSDPRVVYVTPGRDVSMRENFEYALSQATGDYVIFIGDDDGILANGLKTVRLLINREIPDIIIWKHITYLWPHKNSEPKNGHLKFRFRDFCGPMKRLNPRTVLDNFCKGQLVNYRDGANIYHGCVSRRVINKISEKGGVYFQGQIPDVNTAISNLTSAEKMIWIRNPVTLAGQGKKSNGAAMNSGTKIDAAQKKIADSFKTLADADPVTPELDLKIRSIPAYTYANLSLASRVHMNNDLEIDHNRWRKIIIDDLKRFPREHRCWDVLDNFFCQIDVNYKSDPELVNCEKSLEENLDEGRQKSFNKKSKIRPEHIQTVATTADWINKVTGPAYRPFENTFLATMQQIFRMCIMALNKVRTD